MASHISTLMDVLPREQFRTVILLTIGLELHQIADFLETSEREVRGVLDRGCHRAGCRDVKELALRMLYEFENDLLDETRLKGELAKLQLAATRMLDGSSSMQANALLSLLGFARHCRVVACQDIER